MYKEQTAIPMSHVQAIDLHVSAGDVHLVQGTQAGSAWLRYTVKRMGTNASAPVPHVSNGVGAIDVNVDGGNGSEIDAELVVPAGTRVAITSAGGNIDIGSVTGDKEVNLTAGDVKVAVGDLYRDIDAATRIGDIHSAKGLSTAAQQNVGMTGKSMTMRGPGHYSLRVRVAVGDVYLNQ